MTGKNKNYSRQNSEVWRTDSCQKISKIAPSFEQRGNQNDRFHEQFEAKFVITFLYYAGLRLDEVRNLEWDDIDFDRSSKTAKGNNERVMFLHKTSRNFENG